MSDEQARASLRVALNRLRKALGDALLSDASRVWLNPELPVAVDLCEFDRIARRVPTAGTDDLARAESRPRRPAQTQAGTQVAATAECAVESEAEPAQARPHRISRARLHKRV